MQFDPTDTLEAEPGKEAGLVAADWMLRIQEIVAKLRWRNLRPVERREPLWDVWYTWHPPRYGACHNGL